MNPAHCQFRTEVRHLFQITIFNIVFAALAIAFGISSIIAAVSGQNIGTPFPGYRMLTAMFAMVLFGLGIGWLLLTIRVFSGVAAVKSGLDSLKGNSTEERITCLIVRMLAHYRDNRAAIRKMVVVCITGGCVFFILGILNSLEVLTITMTGGGFSLDAIHLIPSMLISLGIAVISLLSSYYFNKFSKTWDRRLREIDESECVLVQSLETETA